MDKYIELLRLGNRDMLQGLYDQAIASYRAAIEMKSDCPDAYTQLGITLHKAGRAEQAMSIFRKAVELDPTSPAARNNLAKALRSAGLLNEAIAEYHHSLAIRPNAPNVRSNLAFALLEFGKPKLAIEECKAAIKLDPTCVEAYGNLVKALRADGQARAAAAAELKYLKLQPKARFSIYNQLAINLQGLGQTEQAMELLQSAIEKFPSHANAHVALGNVLKDLGDVPGSIESYRRALKLDPQSKLAHSNLVYTMLFDPRYDMPAIAQELSRWNQLHAEPLKSEIKPHDNDRASGRRLRIGYVSPDFRNHVIGRNVLPLFKHHNHSQFEIFCYSITKRPDSITDEFRQLADQWRDIGDLTDEQIVAQIRADQIDILVDLALHLNDGRLAVFARKPAPVQVTFAGYPGSTGLTAIDCRPTDPFLEPQGMFDQYSSEKPIRALQSFWCFDPFDSDVPVSPLPAIDNGFITFACFNNFAKVNEQMTGLWSRVLQSVANSRMVILSDKGRHRERIERQLGIDPKRIEFVTQTSRLNYLKHHQRVDICLDTLPYNGHSTSLDALWMGVPVVTIVGQTPVGRAGLSILTNIGLPELIAKTEDEFASVAVNLAKDPNRLQRLRSTLRHTMETSALMDAQSFASNIEKVYRSMWENALRSPAL